ncbi:MAG TPA: hypothetical protein VHF51_03510 [Solirubrobacteraceae bacterium]|nr:hypothetical protein [Solirubrobacteraceae bacterium]
MFRSKEFGAPSARRGSRAAVSGGAALLAAAAFAVPAQGAVTNGQAIEVFHGRDFVNLVGYDPDTPLQVVVRDSAGAPVGFADVVTDDNGDYELNHVGVDEETGVDDCFDGDASPDIIPGDTVEVMVNGDPARVDRTVVQNVQYPDPAYVVDSVARTITVTGFAKTPAGAPLSNVEIRLNHPDGAWDAPDAGNRRDWRVQGQIDAAGAFTAVFEGASDADLANVASAEVSAEWSNVDLSELTVFDGLVTVENPGCPPLARRPIAVPPPVVRPATSGPVTAPAGSTAAAATAPQSTAVARRDVRGVAARALRVSQLSLARRVGLARLNRRGLQASMRLESAARVLRVAIYRARDGRRTGRALFITNRLPRAGGVYRIALRDRRLLRRLRPGLYVIEVRAGESAATLGRAARVLFRVTR